MTAVKKPATKKKPNLLVKRESKLVAALKTGVSGYALIR
jgi:hypothetical protein